MAARFQKQRRIVDLVTMEEIDITGTVKEFCIQHNIDQGSMYRLNDGKLKHIFHRFINSSSLKDCFYLVDIDTGRTYKCITNTTIFLILGKNYNDNEAKYVYELKSGRQYRASVCGKVFQLADSIKRKVKPMKNESLVVSEDIRIAKEFDRIKQRAYARISGALKARSLDKSKKTESLVGCTMAEVVNYIQSKFTDGMSLSNYGEWEVDHIIPCRYFDLSNEDDLKIAFHYTNLQPIWATTKIAKEKGFDNYPGNRNKNGNNTMEDYYMTHLFIKHGNLTVDQARYCSQFLFKNGIRKLLPQHAIL